MNFGPGGEGRFPRNLNPGTSADRNPTKPYHDEISYQAQHTADLELEAAEARKRLPRRLIDRLLRTLRSLL